MPIRPTTLPNIFKPLSIFGIGMLGMILGGLPAGAAETALPWECSGFTDEAQNRCIRTFTQLQQEKIAKLEQEVDAQRQTVQRLEQQVSQQTAATSQLERQLTNNRSRWYGSSSLQVYPPLGLSLRFGRDRFWGGSVWYGTPRFWGRQYYGRGRYGWHHY